MEYKSENRICQNCKKDFVIEPEDFNFYEKIKVPPPTWCPECQFIRRMVFRNQNQLYHRTNNSKTSEIKKLISIYSEDKPVLVYDHNSWWGDSWDVYLYGRDYDFSRPFFEQMRDLIREVPWPNLMNWNSVNSDYCNCTAEGKNCYLVFGGDFSEDCSYCTFNFHSRDSQDLFFVEKCELCYESIDIEDCYRLSFSKFSKNCSDSMFLFDCINCTNCIGCVSLRNKSNCIFNEQYSKEEYLNIVTKFKLDMHDGIEEFKKKFYEFKLKFPHKYAQILKSVNCTGDNIIGGKNCLRCFDTNGGEDLKDAIMVGFGSKNLADSRSVSHAGHGSELIYDSFGVFSGCQNVKFSIFVSSGINVTYGYNCPTGSNLFGCVGVKNGSYCILNKRYSKEEYEKLVPKIIDHMNEMPYIDTQGKVYKYGEFFPTELSPFAYNETIASEHFPLTENQALKQGYMWKKKEERNYKITMPAGDIPQKISEVSDAILNEVLGCEHGGICEDHCTVAFKIIPQELQFYRRLGLPLPRLCPNCRHYERLRSRNPYQLWHRSCMCEKGNHTHGGEKCTVEFETSYSPDRSEIIYCEKCYQSEVY
jgi:hypothetical protein